MPEYLFVYGTLRHGALCSTAGQRYYQLLQQHAGFVAAGRLQAKLYLVDYYPGAVPGDDSAWQVSGEVYQLPQAANLLTELDAYEQCGPGFATPTEYLRLKQQITLQNGDIVTAWVYVYNHSTEGLQQILSGDFLQERAVILEGISRGEQALDAGDVVSHKEAKTKMAKWLK